MADKTTLFLINELIIHTKKLVVVKSIVSCVNEHAKMACLGASTKPGTWNIPKHPGTFRNIPEHPGTGQIITK